MYLSQFEVSPQVGQNPYQLHRKLWLAFPDRPDSDRDFLFRVDWPRHRSVIQVLLQSQSEPQGVSDSNVHLLRSKQIEICPSEGSFLRFVVCANPTKRLADNHRRVGLYKEEEQLAWLERKLNPAAEIKEAQIVSFKTLYFRKPQSGSKVHRGKIVTVTFGGVLEVKDSDQLSRLLQQGIGSAKSFGCGLLSLARI